MPGVLLLGGTFSDLRDGDADPRNRPDIPPHGMYRLLAASLTTAGFAVLRFDRRGCGESTGSRPDRATEIEDGLAAWRWLAAVTGVSSSIAIVGESAGAYVLCRMAAAGATPAAAVLQGALHRSIAGLIGFNAGELRILARADHSMQQTPDDVDLRVRERLSMTSFRRPFHTLYPSVVTDFLTRCLLPGGAPAAPVPAGKRGNGLTGSPRSLP